MRLSYGKKNPKNKWREKLICWVWLRGKKNPFNYIPNVLFSNYNHTPADPLTRKMISRAGRQTLALDLPHWLKSHGRQVKLWELLEPNRRWWLDQLSMKREPSVMTTDGVGEVGGSGKFHTYFVLVKFGEDLNELRHPHVRLLLQEHDPGGVLPEGVRQAAGEDDATPQIKPKKI